MTTRHLESHQSLPSQNCIQPIHSFISIFSYGRNHSASVPLYWHLRPTIASEANECIDSKTASKSIDYIKYLSASPRTLQPLLTRFIRHHVKHLSERHVLSFHQPWMLRTSLPGSSGPLPHLTPLLTSIIYPNPFLTMRPSSSKMAPSPSRTLSKTFSMSSPEDSSWI